jgi:dipeptidase E
MPDLRLLLASNSTNHGEGYLDHCLPAILDVLGPANSLLFIPFALADRAAYGGKARERLAAANVAVDVLVAEPAVGARQLLAAEAVFVGGGNTFRLLKTLEDTGLLPLLRERAHAGMPYMGASAGANLGGPTIRTTNDMPIVQPASFAALGLVPFQINPHYLDPDPGSAHMGETREQRLREFHEENATPVVGLREGAWIRAEGGKIWLGGRQGARIFRRDQPPEERVRGASLADLA